jgi:phytochrome-interacting factor 4
VNDDFVELLGHNESVVAQSQAH